MRAKKTFKLGGETEINRLGFGAMRITGKGVWGWPEDRDAARALLKRVADLGVNFIDTADAYGPEVSEYLIQEALHPYADDLVIATKGGLMRTGPNVWVRNGQPRYLRAALENSLRRLEVERIDLYQYHAPDEEVPFEESVEALATFKQEGKIKHLGLSNVSIEQIEKARAITDVVSVQNRYNLAFRDSDPVVDYCEEHQIGFIPWYPLATGDLTREDNPIAAIASARHVKPSQLALAWLLHRSPVMLPIPGTSSIAHLEENCAAEALSLSEEEFEAISNA